ncbi:siderophore iron transporter-like protein mirB [Boeremia exigua]|uniref:siderophore iron transporter-like protein mirB n=1 Tax=Boeremia exigua TaxID=749465 RepID=UPI001E8ECAB3|nr:siderophore iron transporter-like protein mirB [Boeremia exigua]KAH6643219.1 siderophore iron transporter-like protein mirB [Boeremia exigua]
MSFPASGPQPTAGINQASSSFDAEKNGPIVGQSGSQDAISNTDSDTNEYDIDGEKVQEFQKGVERVRIITSIWSKPTLISMLCLLYLIHFVDMLQNYIDSGLNAYITSEFGAHGLLTVGSVVSTSLGGCTPLTLAKIIDIWGRVEGFVFMLVVCVAGMIVKALCKNVQSYIGGHILYWVGHIGLLYVIDVMCADMTTLKNRMIIFGLNTTPRIAATFAGPKLVELFYYGSAGWRWAFGAFIIILVACSIPAMGVMLYMYSKARKQGYAKKERSGRSLIASLKHYFIELDIFGIILIMAAFNLFMLPFTLQAYAPNGWKTPYIIAMIVLGFLLFPVFGLYEKYVAPVPFLPWKYLKEPTIFGSCLLYGVMFLSVMCWNGMYYSYLQVVHRVNIVDAGYIVNAFGLTSAIFATPIGIIISLTGNFKWVAMAGVPITLLGTALLIPFRQPDAPVGVLAFTQVLVGLGTGIFATCGQLAVMAPVTHQQIASVNALWGLFGGFGSSIGFSIAGAMWNGITPGKLYELLPEESKDQSRLIFGNLTMQMEFLDGTPERAAVVGAYAHSQRLMVIAGSVTVPLCIASIFIWKNINVKKLEAEHGKQTKGTVF